MMIIIFAMILSHVSAMKEDVDIIVSPSEIRCKSLGDCERSTRTTFDVIGIKETIGAIAVFMDDDASRETYENIVRTIVPKIATSESSVRVVLAIGIGPKLPISVVADVLSDPVTRDKENSIKVIAIVANGRRSTERAISATIYKMISERYSDLKSDHSSCVVNGLPLYTDSVTLDIMKKWNVPISVMRHWSEQPGDITVQLPSTIACSKIVDILQIKNINASNATIFSIVVPEACGIRSHYETSDASPFGEITTLVKKLSSDMLNRGYSKNTEQVVRWLLLYDDENKIIPQNQKFDDKEGTYDHMIGYSKTVLSFIGRHIIDLLSGLFYRIFESDATLMISLLLSISSIIFTSFVAFMLFKILGQVSATARSQRTTIIPNRVQQYQFDSWQ